MKKVVGARELRTPPDVTPDAPRPNSAGISLRCPGSVAYSPGS
jgi:hypothetical protein